ncbi:MAG: hypothetical protein RBU37_16890, partial [Myxococcota bacterium]|nr:hypothetical protein [Myxococcota bacterium]
KPFDDSISSTPAPAGVMIMASNPSPKAEPAHDFNRTPSGNLRRPAAVATPIVSAGMMQPSRPDDSSAPFATRAPSSRQVGQTGQAPTRQEEAAGPVKASPAPTALQQSERLSAAAPDAKPLSGPPRRIQRAMTITDAAFSTQTGGRRRRGRRLDDAADDDEAFDFEEPMTLEDLGYSTEHLPGSDAPPDTMGGLLMSSAADSAPPEPTANAPRQPAPRPMQQPAATNAAPAARNVHINGWSSSSPVQPLSDGFLLYDGRYTISTQLPLNDAFITREAVLIPNGLEEFLATYRKVVIGIGVALFVSMLSFFLHWLLGMLLLGASLAVAAAMTFVAWMARDLGKRPKQVSTPSEAIREYLAAIRLGLYHRAKSMLAIPKDVDAVPVSELFRSGRTPFGVRFNTLPPASLKLYWWRRIAEFDGDAKVLPVQWLDRFSKPLQCDIEELLFRDHPSACIAIVRGRGFDSYTVVPTVELNGAWYVADGEMLLASVRVEALGRLASEHASHRLNDAEFLLACTKQNLTRADIQRARGSGVISEAQARLLVQTPNAN